MRRHRRTAAALTGAAVLLTTLVACGTDESAGTDGSTDEATAGDTGELTVYSGRNEELIDPLIARMEEATGLDITVRYGDTAELAAALMEEGDRTAADLFIAQDAGALGALSREGLLRELPAGTLEEVEPAFRGSADDWIGISGRARVVVWNAENVEESELPTDYRELNDARWEGRVGYAPTNASFQSFVTALRVLEGEDAALEWLTDLREHGEVYERNGAILDAVNAGEIDLGLINHYYWFAKAAEEGEENLDARLHFLSGGDPGSLINVAGVGVTARGDGEEAALKAVDFLLSEEAQLYFAEETKEYPLAAGVTSPVEGLPPLESIEAPDIDLTDLDSLERTLELLREAGMV
ncbi:iron ABC transporter substrate-binding protein [Streptomyces sp. ST2-7A]|uniref:iron ABC transporter substrate-binding protein n=1 Tax=Streptomyces sp. ST2-7A TaxID=2907214 RepID=UPI001F392DBA|nr:iron ABC transporter substrate-binding protein [Streptomyces sp. ST2-7A]MCE7082604.1 iron ABC transporter substrate-binding protein [Streptomyces sp. ST2-7A]